MKSPHRKTLIKCFLIVTFACLLFSNIAVLHGQNASSSTPSDQSNIPQPDATGENTGTVKDVPAKTPGEPTFLELANSVGHNIIAINMVWTLVAGFLVFFMQAGFAYVETGFTRAKNVAHTMAMNIFIYGLGMLGWYVCGFALMFGGLPSLPTLGGFTGLNSEFTISILGKSFGLFGGHGFFLTGATM
jgi:Amt family ammonium transporter